MFRDVSCHNSYNNQGACGCQSKVHETYNMYIYTQEYVLQVTPYSDCICLQMNVLQ